LRLWIDTDVGDNPDDAVALVLAARHPSIDFVGISTVGNRPEIKARYAMDLLESIGAPAPLVYAGPPDPRALAAADALLAIGPLGNVAALVSRGVALPPTAAMGGTLAPVEHRGARRTIESNFGADPGAAMLVLHGVADLLLVPLDVTAAMRASAQQEAFLGAASPLLAEAIANWREQRDAPLCLHDPVALLALAGEAGAAIERAFLTVAADGTVVHETELGARVDAVRSVDRARCWQRIAEVLEGD
jgi:inosine-uridine nucleoside N-ribohydrolase